MKLSTYVLAGLFAILATLSLTLPRMTGRSQEGFAAGAAAAGTFLLLAVLAALVALILFVITLRRFPRLDLASRVVGILPFGIVLAGAALLAAHLH